MIYGYDDDAPGMRQALRDGHAMMPSDMRTGSDLHAAKYGLQGAPQPDHDTGYAMFGDKEARRALRNRRWNSTMVRSMNKAAFGRRPSSWDHAGSTGDLGEYAGGGILGLMSAQGGSADAELDDEFGEADAFTCLGCQQRSLGAYDDEDDYEDDYEDADEGLGAPPTGNNWHGAVATINGLDEYNGGGLLGLGDW